MLGSILNYLAVVLDEQCLDEYHKKLPSIVIQHFLLQVIFRRLVSTIYE